MDVKSASLIVALRPAIERLIVYASGEPESILTLNEIDMKLIEILKELCSFNSGRYNMPQISFDHCNESYHKRRFNDQGNTVPSTKRFNGGGGYSGRGVGYNQGRGSYSGNNLSFGRGGGYNQRGGYGGSPSGRGYGSFRGNDRGFNRRY